MAEHDIPFSELLRKVLNGEVIPDKSKLFDADGLYINLRKLKKPNRHGGGYGMSWCWNYDFNGTSNTFTYGTYPKITITEARKQHREALTLRAKGIDPAAQKRASKEKQKPKEPTFREAAEAWRILPKNLAGWGEDYTAKVKRVLEKEAYPYFGNKRLSTIKPKDIIEGMEGAINRGARSQAELLHQITNQIFRYAKIDYDITGNPADFKAGDVLPDHIVTPRPTFTDRQQIAKLLHDIDAYTGHIQTVFLLKLAPYFMLRPVELRRAEWKEFDLQASTWIIPVVRMKARQHVKRANLKRHQHTVPLASQVVKMLEELHTLTGYHTHLFPSVGKAKEPCLSSATINAALRAMGYDTKTEITAHGFRAMASTSLNRVETEDGSRRWDSDLIEQQLAHREDTIRNMYNRPDSPDAIRQRGEMLQEWADYLDGLRDGAQVIPIHRNQVADPLGK